MAEEAAVTGHSLRLGKWSQPGVPRRGWDCVEVEDLGADHELVCEMCETSSIRYVHYMKHLDYLDILGCGCICAEHMGEVYAKEHERTLKCAVRRRNRNLSAGIKSIQSLMADLQVGLSTLTRGLHGWERSRNGNSYMKIAGFYAVIFSDKYRPGKWRGKVQYDDGPEKWSQRLHSSEDSLMKAQEAYIAEQLRLEIERMSGRLEDEQKKLRAPLKVRGWDTDQ